MAEEAKAAANVKKPLAKPKKGPLEMAEFFYSRKALNIWLFASSLLLMGSCFYAIVQDHVGNVAGLKIGIRQWKDYQMTFREIEYERALKEKRLVELEMKKNKQKLDDNRAAVKVEEEKIKNNTEPVPAADLKAIQDDVAALKAFKTSQSKEIQKEIDAAFERLLPVVAELQKPHKKTELKAFRDDLEATWFQTKQNFEFIQADYMVIRWEFDHTKDAYDRAVKGEGNPIKAEPKFRAVEKKFYDTIRHRDLRRRLYDLSEKVKTSITEAMTRLDKPIAELKKEEAVLTKERDAIAKKLSTLDYTIDKKLRDAPMLDFFAKTLEVKQVVLSNIYDDLNFVQIGKVDRCHTCHLGIDNPAYEAVKDSEGRWTFKDAEIRKIVETKFPNNRDDQQAYTNMFMAHPRLHLFVGGGSPHKLNQMGCTVCHGGDGRETDFSLAVHTANDEEQEKHWKRRYGYHHRSHSPTEHHPLWDEPMMPKKYIESSCRKCHSQEVEIKGADTYTKGMLLFERAGCYACHKTDTYPVLNKHLATIGDGKLDEAKRMRRPGPPLTHVMDKVTKEWAYNWVLAPRDYRPTTKMPHFFRQLNARKVTDMHGKTHEAVAVENVVAASMIEFIFNQSETRKYPAPPGKGDAENGKLLSESLGCYACHSFDETAKTLLPEKYSPYLQEFAPNLAGTGDKMNATWLFHWLKSPEHYMAQTRMPSLRLTDQEALDIAAYLMTLKIDNNARRVGGWKAWEPKAPPLKIEGDEVRYADPADQRIVEQLVFEQLKAGMIELDAKQKLQSMKEPERVRFLGQKMAGPQYGCYACHELKGFDEIDGIGVELTGAQPWGSKLLDRLDFGRTKYDGVAYHGVSFQHAITKEDYLHRDPGNKNPKHVEIHESRADFLRNKLLEPRIFDGGLTESKPFDELLRMPNFNFTTDEAELLTTFVLSFTHHEVRGLMREARHVMDEKETAINRGNRIIRESNCASCHRFQLDRFEVDFRGEKKNEWVWIEGKREKKLAGAERDNEVKKLQAAGLIAEGRDPARVDVYRFTWVNDHRHLTVPAAVNPNQRIVFFDGFDWFYPTADGKSAQKIRQFDPQVGGDVIEHIRALKGDPEAYPDKKSAEAVARMYNIDSGNKSEFEVRFPPFLRTQGIKTQPEWLFEFLKRPTKIRPNLVDGAMFPKAAMEFVELVKKTEDSDEDTFQDDYKKIVEASKKLDPELQKKLKLTPAPKDEEELQEMAKPLLEAIAMPEPNIRMPTFGFTDEEAAALVKYFWAKDAKVGVDMYPSTTFEERVNPDTAKIKAVQAEIEKNCVQCHYMDGNPPNTIKTNLDGRYKFGPDFDLFEKRLRPRWLRAWLPQPSEIYPGTPMTDIRGVADVEGTIHLLMNWSKFHGTKTTGK